MGHCFRAHVQWEHDPPVPLVQPYPLSQGGRLACATLLTHVDDAAVLEAHRPLDLGPFQLLQAGSSTVLATGSILAEAGESVIQKPKLRRGLTVWFTGLSSAGKSTIARGVYSALEGRGAAVVLLDGDELRRTFCHDLGFSKQDRDENIRRIGFIAELAVRRGEVALVAAISPYRELRQEVRTAINDFVEVYVNAPLAIAESRDLKGIYRRCRAGELHGVTGIDDPYEVPLAPEVECRTDSESISESVARVIRAIEPLLA